MPTSNRRTVCKTLMVCLSFAGGAWAQSPASKKAPASAIAPQAAPPPAEPGVPPLPAAAQPAVAPQPAAAPPASASPVPPGYMLVPIPDSSGQTRYDVQYPQTRGALPPGMELPYEDGDPIPPGYRLRKQPRRGLIITGSILTGVPWALSVTGAVGADFDDKSGYLLVPALGPWLMLLAGGAKDEDCPSTSDFCSGSRSGLRSVLVLDGLVQTAGAVLFTVGIAVPRKRLVRDDVTVGVMPARFGSDGYGVGAFGTF